MDYLKALERAILYIENHLGEDIKVEDAAAAAPDMFRFAPNPFA